MKQEIDNNAMWAAFRQELALQGELHVVAAIDNALNNLGFTIEETSSVIPIPLKQGEQKPYGQREECLDCQMNYAGECKGSCAMKKIEQKPADTEKGAKGNEREIPNSAWSEEDEVNLVRALTFIKNTSLKDVDEIKESVLTWITSLKDRYTWKPSDKQMDALRYVTNFDYGGHKATLVSLYEQLKKLK